MPLVPQGSEKPPHAPKPPHDEAPQLMPSVAREHVVVSPYDEPVHEPPEHV